jgi:Ca2+-binding RTX toxin-like protein
MADINGTPGNDTINGTEQDDRIDAGAGDDTINGLGGNDFIDGGSGNDTINGGDGDDRLFSYSGTDLLIGGIGNDEILVQNSNFGGETNSSVDAGDGNDTVTYFATGVNGTVNLGAGNDTLNLALEGNGTRITLGSGTDVVLFTTLSFSGSGQTVVTDFATGNSGDRIDLSRIMQFNLFNYDKVSNPFGTGHFRLVASGADTLLTLHPNPDFGPTHTIRFLNVAPSAFTAFNFSGINPNGVSTNGPPINGTPGNDTLDGTNLGETISGFGGDDVINAGGGDDTLIGGAGADTLNGGEGDDRFIFDLTFGPDENPLLDTINGGNGTDTLRVIGSNQGFEITTYDLGAPFFTSIEGLELSGNLGLIGTVAQVGAYSTIVTPNLRITDNALLDPTGRFEVIQLSLPNGGARADLSGPGVFVLNIVSGDGDDNIIGPDGALANPSPNQTDIEVGIDVRFGNDTVVAGNVRTRIISQGGNNHFTGSAFNDSFLLFGDGDNTLIGGGGNDNISVFGNGRLNISGGAGNDTIQVASIGTDDTISGGDGFDRLIIDTGNVENLDLTGVAISGDFEAIASAGQGNVIMRVAQLQAIQQLELRFLTLADGGSLTLTAAPLQIRFSTQATQLDMTAVTTTVQVFGNRGNDTIIGGSNFDSLQGGAGDDSIYGNGGDDFLSGGDGVDLLMGGDGNDNIDGGSNVDTAVMRGNRSAYTITQSFLDGSFTITGPDGTDTLRGVEFVQFDDQTVRLRPGAGVSVNFETADRSVYQEAMNAIRDFDGNFLGGGGAWLRIGSADVNGDGDIDQILVNFEIGRFATVGTAPDGLVYFMDFSWAGETRVAGIYIDPLVRAGVVQPGSPNDSQRRFQNDLFIENINRVLGADDYDNDGLQEVYFALTDGTAYLRAIMEFDGNIRYANYQSQQEVIDYLTANGFGPETYAGWFSAPSGAEASLMQESIDFADASGLGRADLRAVTGAGASNPGVMTLYNDASVRHHFVRLDEHLPAEFYG